MTTSAFITTCFATTWSRLFNGRARLTSAAGFLTALVLTLVIAACGDDDDAQPAMLTGEFLALTYNVAGLPEGISGSHPLVNTPQISPLLNGYDLVLVQESWLTPEDNPLAPLRVYHELLEADALHPFRSEPAPQPADFLVQIEVSSPRGSPTTSPLVGSPPIRTSPSCGPRRCPNR